MSKERSPHNDKTLTRRRRVEEIFDAALDVTPRERAAFLERVCAGDGELQHEVQELLEAEREQTRAPLPSRKLAGVSALADLAPSLPRLSLAPGMQIGRYELLRSVGQGGMGTVFLAYDTRLHRRVAIKLLHATTREMTERFLIEARATARCKHENIVIIHDVGELDGHPYTILEYLEGESLRQRLGGLAGTAETASAAPAPRRLRGGSDTPAMPVAEVLSLVTPVVRALVCAHEHGFVHRDLKPENVFLCSNGAIKVLDFGIAKVLADTHGPDGIAAGQAGHAVALLSRKHPFTEQGALLGTLPYMSPEQWGTGEIDERTDLWAVGIMLYEMLAGRHPLWPLSFSNLLKQVPDLDLPMPSMDAAVPGLGELAQVVDSCLRKHKTERMPSAAALLDALESVLARQPTNAAETPLQATRTDAPGSVALSGVGAAGSSESLGQESSRAAAPSRKRRVAAAGLGLGLGLGLVAVMLIGLWPRLSIPAFPGSSGGIVLAVDTEADEPLLEAHHTLCAALRELDAQAIRCVELPRFGIDDRDLLRASARAGASLIAQLDSQQELRLRPVSPAAELLSELPTLAITDTRAQQHLAGILLPLSRALRGDLRFDALRTPPVTAHDVGWRLAALAWYLNVLARNQQAIPPADLRSTMTRCRQEASLADLSCALAHYVYTQLDPTPPDAAHWLDELLADGPPVFADLAAIEQASEDCMREPERAGAAVVRMAARWSHAPCRRLALMGAAACLVTKQPDASQALQSIAYPNDETIDSCEADLAAAALAERGQWSMLARRWQQAAADFDAAWKRGNHPADLLNWAESLLHQRDSGIDVAGPIAAGLDLRYFDAELVQLAAFLRWLATRDPADQASILRLYSESPIHASVLVDDEGTLASLVCMRPEDIECRVYSILRGPKQPGSEEELRRLLVAGNQR